MELILLIKTFKIIINLLTHGRFITTLECFIVMYSAQAHIQITHTDTMFRRIVYINHLRM